MNITEVIQVRAFNRAALPQATLKAWEFLENISSDNSEYPPGHPPDRPDDIQLLIRSDLETDMCILLSWVSDKGQAVKSELGLELATFFSDYGWVLHSLWKVVHNVEKKGVKGRVH